jgi:hypothetical protein
MDENPYQPPKTDSRWSWKWIAWASLAILVGLVAFCFIAPIVGRVFLFQDVSSQISPVRTP